MMTSGDGELDDIDVERANEIEDVTAPISVPGDAETADDAAQLDSELAAAVAENDALRDKLLRLQADFENHRKRTATQHLAEVDRATGRIMEALLPVLDACEAAFVAHPAEIEPLFNLILGELRKLGLEALELENTPFDPTTAEAVIHEPGEGGEPTVAEVLRTGYTWKGKVLRAAMVKVKD